MSRTSYPTILSASVRDFAIKCTMAALAATPCDYKMNGHWQKCRSHHTGDTTNHLYCFDIDMRGIEDTIFVACDASSQDGQWVAGICTIRLMAAPSLKWVFHCLLVGDEVHVLSN